MTRSPFETSAERAYGPKAAFTPAPQGPAALRSWSSRVRGPGIQRGLGLARSAPLLEPCGSGNDPLWAFHRLLGLLRRARMRQPSPPLKPRNPDSACRTEVAPELRRLHEVGRPPTQENRKVESKKLVGELKCEHLLEGCPDPAAFSPALLSWMVVTAAEAGPGIRRALRPIETSTAEASDPSGREERERNATQRLRTHMLKRRSLPSTPLQPPPDLIHWTGPVLSFRTMRRPAPETDPKSRPDSRRTGCPHPCRRLALPRSAALPRP
jgi:hypothetical protein